MKAGTQILFSNATTREHAGSGEPFWGKVKDTLIRNGHTIYLTEYLQPSKYGDQATITTLKYYSLLKYNKSPGGSTRFYLVVYLASGSF